MLWFSAALHAAVIGLTRLPPQQPASPSLELQVELMDQPAAPAPQVLPAQPVVVPEPTLLNPEPAPVASQPIALPAPAPTNKTAVETIPVPAAVPVPQSGAPAASSVTLNVATRDAPGPQVNIPLAVDSRYYQARELDVIPKGLRGEPEMPQRAVDAGVGGRVEVRLHLEADGTISSSEVVSVKPGGVFGELFKKSVLEWVRGQRLQPATRGGRAVRAILIVPVVFPEPEN